MNSNLIFWPVVIQALITLWMYVPMSRARIASVKTGESAASDFKLPNVDERGSSRQLANAVTNQFELPVLYFAVCLAAHQAGFADAVMIVLAFAFVVAKTAHTYIHSTSNRLRHRRPVFMSAYVIVMLMWLWFALRLLTG